jgi:hypothetical protein
MGPLKASYIQNLNCCQQATKNDMQSVCVCVSAQNVFWGRHKTLKKKKKLILKKKKKGNFRCPNMSALKWQG